MSLATALIYWVIISLWLAVLTTVCVAFVRNPRTFGTIRLLLSVLSIDTLRNIIENIYFGLYFGGSTDCSRPPSWEFLVIRII